MAGRGGESGAATDSAARRAPDAVRTVLAEMRPSRTARMLRRFRHGAGGASLVSVDGRTLVLKAWPCDSAFGDHLPVAFRFMRAMRARGVPIPEPVEDGTLAGLRYVLYEHLPGRWPARVTGGLLDELLGVVDAERGAAPGEGRDWGWLLRSMLFGEAHRDVARPFEIELAVLESHRVGRALLREARTRLDVCVPALMHGGDVVHGDFAPENVLVCGRRLCGVVDWEQCRAGDAGFDLVGMLFDIELGPKAAPAAIASLHLALRERVPPPILAAYTAIYAARYASWAIGTSAEPEVLELGDRLVRAT
jgi:Ser/Thr protein kinase RdoA (MazF antagonist)